MGSCCSDLCENLQPQTILFNGFLCAFNVLTFIYWVHDPYMTVVALLHCIGSILIIIGSLTLFCLYLPHMVNYHDSTTKGRKSAGVMILIGGLLHFIGAILAISNPLYCNFFLCEIHLFVFMILPFSLTIILFLDEFYGTFTNKNRNKIRFRVVIYSFILFLSALLFIPYYATIQKNEAQVSELMAILYQIIWIVICINTLLLMICIGCKHKSYMNKPRYSSYDNIKKQRNTTDTWASNTLSSQRGMDDSIISIQSDDNRITTTRGGPHDYHSNSYCCCDFCGMHETKRSTIIIIASVLLIVFGSSSLITIYFYSFHDRYDVIICYYFLVVIMSWFIGIDSYQYYRRMDYSPIHDQNRKRRQKTNSNDRFDDGMGNEYESDDQLIDNGQHGGRAYDDNPYISSMNRYNENERRPTANRMIMEHADLNYGDSNHSNQWGLPPSQEMNDPYHHHSGIGRGGAYD